MAPFFCTATSIAPQHGSIEVAVQRHGATAEISVSDNGPGIDELEKVKVVQRFYRGDASRGTPGVGLGLSLVQAVAKLHGSPLELRDNSPGLRAVLILPAEESGSLLRETVQTQPTAADAVSPSTLVSLP